MSDANYSERLKATKRNDPCPCGSGQKYKKCHMAGDEAELRATTKAAQEAAAKAAAEAAAAAEGDAEADAPAKKETSANVERPNARQNQPGRGSGQNPRPKNLPRRKAV